MRRKFSNVVVIGCILAYAATVMLWIRSYRLVDRADRLLIPIAVITRPSPSQGRLWLFVFESAPPNSDPVARIDETCVGLEPLLLDREVLGFTWTRAGDGGGDVRVLAVPHGAVTVALAVPP